MRASSPDGEGRDRANPTRPAWAGPIQPVEEWDAALVAAAPEIARPFLQSLNTTGKAWEQQHKPEGMQSEAPGINPSRWGEA